MRGLSSPGPGTAPEPARVSKTASTLGTASRGVALFVGLSTGVEQGGGSPEAAAGFASEARRVETLRAPTLAEVCESRGCGPREIVSFGSAGCGGPEGRSIFFDAQSRAPES